MDCNTVFVQYFKIVYNVDMQTELLFQASFLPVMDGMPFWGDEGAVVASYFSWNAMN